MMPVTIIVENETHTARRTVVQSLEVFLKRGIVTTVLASLEKFPRLLWFGSGEESHVHIQDASR